MPTPSLVGAVSPSLNVSPPPLVSLSQATSMPSKPAPNHDFLHSSFLVGHLSRCCMHDMGPSNSKWGASMVLPPHEVALGLYSTQVNVGFFFLLALLALIFCFCFCLQLLYSAHALATSTLVLHIDHKALKTSHQQAIDQTGVLTQELACCQLFCGETSPPTMLTCVEILESAIAPFDLGEAFGPTHDV